MTDLVSIIVPVYKVEPYLRQCLDSALAQTHRDIEVIVVDDGSPDGCPTICDEYAAADPRVRVIHQANGGISVARNAALDAARGDWIMFLDGDDWLEPKLVQTVLAVVHEREADLVVFDFDQVFDDGRTWAFITDLPEGVYTGDEVLLALCEEKIRNNLCHILCAEKVVRDVRFPVGETCEDAAVWHRYLDAAETVAVTHQNGYRYRSRSDSVSANTSLHYSRCEMLQFVRRLEYVRPKGEAYALPAERTAVHMSLKHVMRLAHIGMADELLETRRFLADKNVRRGSLSAKRTVLWWLFRHAPRLLIVLTRAADKVTGYKPALESS